MRAPAIVLALVALLVAGPSTATQDDPVLDRLFARLHATHDAREVRRLEAAIWSAWTRSGDPAIDRRMNRGIELMAAGAHLAALVLFDGIVRDRPDFAEGWNKRATVYFLLRRDAESVADIERTLALEPRHFGALSGLSMVHMRRGETEAALEAIERALTVNPHLTDMAALARALRETLGLRDL